VGQVVRDKPGARERAVAPARTSVAGPAAPALPTLGEALFATDMTPRDGAAAPRRTSRSVLVLVPRVPGSYRLLPGGLDGAAR